MKHFNSCWFTNIKIYKSVDYIGNLPVLKTFQNSKKIDKSILRNQLCAERQFCAAQHRIFWIFTICSKSSRDIFESARDNFWKIQKCPWQVPVTFLPVTFSKCPWQFSKKYPWHWKSARDKNENQNVTGTFKCHGKKKKTLYKSIGSSAHNFWVKFWGFQNFVWLDFFCKIELPSPFWV